MSSAGNFRLVEPYMELHRRVFEVASGLQASLDPYDTNPVSDGEWLSLDSSYNLARAADSHGTITVQSFPVLDLKGQYDVQASKRLTVAMGGFFEADTRICTTTSIVLGSPLVVADVSPDAGTNKGLILLPANGGGTAVVGWIVGYCTKAPADGWIRFARVDPQRVAIPAS